MDRQARRDSIVSQISATEAGRQALTVLVEQSSFLNILATTYMYSYCRIGPNNHAPSGHCKRSIRRQTENKPKVIMFYFCGWPR